MPSKARLKAPVVVVGLPRSGSSFLSHVLSQLSNWYVFDDLYLQRKARTIGVKDPLTNEDLKTLLNYLGWQIRARLRRGLYSVPNVAESEVEPMNDALAKAFAKEPGNWADLQEEWMHRLAARTGCSNWGYKLPSAFRHIKELIQEYPNLRLLFLIRDPYEVLASYKHMPQGAQDGDPRRYHPVPYALYWRSSVRTYLSAKTQFGSRVALVQFKDLADRPLEAARQIADFLGTDPPEEVEVPVRRNSSFRDPSAKSGLTGLEKWLVRMVATSELAALGYEFQTTRIRAADVGDLVSTTFQFTLFQLTQIGSRLRDRLKHKFGSIVWR